MPNSMSFSERFLAGFALAATVAKDPGAALAREGLAEHVADAMTHTARAWQALDKVSRRARIRNIGPALRGGAGTLAEVQGFSLPLHAAPSARAYALLVRFHRPAPALRGGAAPKSTEVPGWLRATPLPRAGYTPEPQLIALLARIAARTARVSPAAASEGSAALPSEARAAGDAERWHA